MLTFKTTDEAVEARTHAAARIGHHLRRAANMALNEFDLGIPFDNEMAQVVAWRLKMEAAQRDFLRLNNAYQDELEVRNGG